MTEQTLYIALQTNPWIEGTITAQVPGGISRLPIHTRNFTNAPHSFGYCPVYDSLDKLREDFPEARVLRVTVSGTRESDAPNMALETPVQKSCNDTKSTEPPSA